MEDWKECTIGEITNVQTGPFGSQLHEKDYVKEGTPIVTVEHLGNRKFKTQNLPLVSDSDKKRLSKYILTKGDLVFSRVGSVDRCTYTAEENDGWMFSGRCLRVRPYENIDALFLYYYFNLDSTKQFIRNIAVGATMPSINTALMCEVPVKLPPLPTQKKIAQILSSLDDKIELNNKINANLEQQAQALFKSWFVDFEPFDGEMPAGWKVGKLSDVIETTINGDWGKDEPIGTNTEEVFCIRGADIPEVKIGNKGKMPTRYIPPKNWNQKKLTDGDLVVEISGGSPTQSTGRVAYISNALLDRYNNKIICTNFCKAVKPHKNLSMYVYYLWQHLYNKDVFFNYENGTTGVKNLDMNGILMNEDIVIPAEDYLKKFNDFCSLVFKEIFANGNETEKLSNLRDTLLPKLMNGEIEV